MIGRAKPPIYPVTRRGSTTWTINLDPAERAMIVRLLGELRELLTGDVDGDTPSTASIVNRLFPPAFLDDPEKEAEYQRLMREELITSRLTQIDSVTASLAPDAVNELDEGQVIAMMQSINAVRVVLGTMLDVGEDDDIEPGDDETAEHQLYSYLSWLLDWTVRSLSA